MFNWGNRRPTTRILTRSGLTINQRLSIKQLLGFVASAGTWDEKKEKIVRYYAEILDIPMDFYENYADAEFYQRLIDDINLLNRLQKESLIIPLYQIITCIGEPSEKEISLVILFLSKIGLKEAEIVTILENSSRLIQVENSKLGI